MDWEEVELLKANELRYLRDMKTAEWWRGSTTLAYGQVVLRILFWWDTPDQNGNRHYWQAALYIVNHETRMRDILQEFLSDYLDFNGQDPRAEDYDMDWAGYPSFLNPQLCPLHYLHMGPFATIVVDPK
ncbi:hypothetical protein IAT38_005347 [Cryptococcus sp. DSM 104549]